MATETVGGPVIIDLGLDRGEPDSYTSPTRSTRPRWFAPLLIGLLVLIFSTGSTAPPPPALSPLLNLPFGPADSYAVTDAGQLLTQNSGTLSSYDLTTGRLRWQAESLTPTYRLRTGSGVVLLRPWAIGPGQPSTTAISETTGAVRWQREASVVPVPGSSALLAVSAVRSIVGAGRRVEGPVESVDPRTGATRWRVEVPVTAVLMGVPGPAGQPPRMLLVHDNRTMALHDLATGRLLITAPLPAADYGPGNPAVAGGLIVLQYATRGRFLVSAFDPVTLRPVWVQQAGAVAEADTCGVLICLAGSSSGIEAVEPATGGQRWYQPRWRSVEQRGSLLVAYGTPIGVSDLIGIVDPATGRVLVDLRGWRTLTGLAGPDQLLVSRTVEGTGRILLAVAGPRDRQPRPLADLPAGTGDCQAVPGRLICRSSAGELTVWEYRLSRPSRRSG